MRFIDPDGMEMTDFLDKEGKKILHVEDGSNAVFKLEGKDHTDESFQFTENYSDQGGIDEVSVEGAIAGAQDYVINNYTLCNQAVNFVGRTAESAAEATGAKIEGVEHVNGDKTSNNISSGLSANGFKGSTISEAKSSAETGNLVIGTAPGHVTTMTTKDFEMTRYNKDGTSQQFRYIGGQIANVNGGTTTGLGPKRNNSYQPPERSYVKTLYSLTLKVK
jgi:hypothetical protein